jgi:hypothetical protein
VISSGSTVWIPEIFKPMFVGRDWDDFYFFSDRDKLINILRGLQRLSWADRVEINEDQTSLIAHHTPSYRMQEFEDIVEKYADLHKTQPATTVPLMREHLRNNIFGDQPGDNERTLAMKAERRRVLKGKYSMKYCKVKQPITVGITKEDKEKYGKFK